MTTDSLIEVADLAAILGAPDLRIIDASWFLPTDERNGVALHRERHIPGAIFFDIDKIADTTSDLPHMLPSPESFAETVGGMGISENHRIVVYDALGMFSAARVRWTFLVMGANDVSILHGGLPAWEAAGQPMTGETTTHPPTTFTPTLDASAVVTLAEVEAALRSGSDQIVDARPAPRFHGHAAEPRPGARSGHMPGSFSMPLDKLVRDGRMIPDAEIEQVFADAGIDLGRPIVTSCGSGVTAAVLLLALERLGVKDARLYDGSWSEWGVHPDTAVTVSPQA